MAFRLMFVGLFLTFGACILTFGTSTAANPEDSVVLSPETLANSSATADGDAKFSYVGSKKCKKCHLKVHKSWEKTDMGMALDSLKPGDAADVKKKFKLDPEKDYTSDATCLPCHVTGYGKPGGYAPPDPADKKAVKQAASLQGVGCESCHGPGSAYVKVFDEIKKSKRKYKVEELYAVGMRKVDKTVCVECHTDKSPTLSPDQPFDYEKQKDEGTHEHETLKQREE